MEMRRLVTGKQMKEIDGYAIRKVGIPSLVLMERAALAVAAMLTVMVAAKSRERSFLDRFITSSSQILDNSICLLWEISHGKKCCFQCSGFF